MEINVNLYDKGNEIKRTIERAFNEKIDKMVAEKLATMDVSSLITDRVNKAIDKSKYLSDTIIRNLVQQKIAREIAEKSLLP